MINQNEYQTKQFNPLPPEKKMIRQIKDRLDKSKDDKELIIKVAKMVNVPNIIRG
jgi:sugar-specific transcriptional regulator TrmB